MATNARVLENVAKREEIHARFTKALNDNNLEELRQIILDYEVVCPISGTKNWTEVRQFNLMFATEMGSTTDGAQKYISVRRLRKVFLSIS
jgi:glycyl-tRNA synthetase (EC 6.1.1.14)